MLTAPDVDLVFEEFPSPWLLLFELEVYLEVDSLLMKEVVAPGYYLSYKLVF